MALPSVGAPEVFSWDDAWPRLAGLPDGGVNIAHEAVDRHVAEGRGDHLALICLGRRYQRREFSYAALAGKTARCASVLRDLGVGPGDVVAVLMDRSAELYAIAFGIWKAGAVFCPLFGAFGPGPLKARLKLAEAKVLIASEDVYRNKIASARAALPALRHVLLVGEDGAVAGDLPGCADFAALAADAGEVETVSTSRDEPAFLHFTSGTTGTPKGVLHSHGSVLAHLVTARHVFNLKADDVYWCTADPGWITNTAYALIAPLVNGCTVVVDAASFDPRRWYGILKDEKVTVWYTTPTNIRMMMRFGAALARSYRENSLRLAASVGEPLNSEAVNWGEKYLGAPFLDTWWQTETGAISIANLPGKAKPGSMGLPLPGVEAAVVRREGMGLEFLTEVDAVGELALKGSLPSMFVGYANDPQRYSAAFVDGWYLTGDLVRRDAQGYFWFVSRVDDMIKVAGQAVGPFEIECALMRHPAVAEIGVVGKPDLLVREIPVAFVSLNAGFEPGEALELELLSFARQELGNAMAPREIRFVETMPKTSTGKILRRALKAEADSDAQEEGVDTALGAGRFDDE